LRVRVIEVHLLFNISYAPGGGLDPHRALDSVVRGEIFWEALVIEKMGDVDSLALLIKGIGGDAVNFLIRQVVNRFCLLHHGIKIWIGTLLCLRGEEKVNAINVCADRKS